MHVKFEVNYGLTPYVKPQAKITCKLQNKTLEGIDCLYVDDDVEFMGEGLNPFWGNLDHANNCRYRTITLTAEDWDNLQDKVADTCYQEFAELLSVVNKNKIVIDNRPKSRIYTFFLQDGELKYEIEEIQS